jgi:tRNA/tmRNA/rRNA uracil-C5-methylase (TrmA/RlmC/RlmD family)
VLALFHACCFPVGRAWPAWKQGRPPCRLISLETSQKNWDQLAKEDPLWAILTDPSKKDGRWQPEEFFQTGVAEIAKVMQDLSRQGLTPGRDRALDFGCTVGPLSQALAGWFGEVHGVDVSPSMIELANRFNNHRDRCHYHLNADGHLRRFPDNHFDLLYNRHHAPTHRTSVPAALSA